MRELNNGYRPCTVNGRRGIFHRWVDKESLCLKLGRVLSVKERTSILDYFKKDQLLAYDAKPVTIIKYVVGMVEFGDGSIEEIIPDDITFLDSDDYLFGEEDVVSIYHTKRKQVTVYKFTNENKDYVYNELGKILGPRGKLSYCKNHGNLYLETLWGTAREGDYIVVLDKDRGVLAVMTKKELDDMYEKGE